MRFVFLIYLAFLANSLKAVTYYVTVDNPCASDGNTGLASDCVGADGPFKTIDFATSLLVDGDSIVLGQGTYYEHPIISNVRGILITALGDGPVILSGAMEEYTLANNNQWTYEGKRYSVYHNDSFNVYYSTYPAYYTPAASWNNTLIQNIAVDDNGKKLYTYVDSVLFTQRHQPSSAGEGVYFDYDKMYISFDDDTKNPNDVCLFVSGFYDLFYFHSNCEVTIDGGVDQLITVDHTGRFGIHSTSGAQMNLLNLKFKNGHNNVYEGPTAGSTLIDNCEFSGGHDSLWTWTGIKDCVGNPGGDYSLSGCYTLPDLSTNSNAISGLVSQESFAILLRGDTAHHTVSNCKIEGFFNGIAPLAGAGVIENNQIWNIYDDALEPEGELELIIRNNSIWDVFVCHAGVTTEEGPVYSYENIYCANKNVVYSYDFDNDVPGVIWQARPLKYYSTIASPATNTHFYYNTIYGVIKPLQIGAGGCNSSNKAINSSVFNNIFISENQICSNSGQQLDGIEIRSNLFHSTISNAGQFNCWNGPSAYVGLPTGSAMPVSWTGNIESDPIIEGGSVSASGHYFRVESTSPTRVVNGFSLEAIPSTWPGASFLNSNRTNAGALEYQYDLNMGKDPLKSSVNLYPNPTEKEFTITGENISSVEVYNCLGQKVYFTTSWINPFTGVSSWISGVYFVLIKTEDEIFYKRLIVK